MRRAPFLLAALVALVALVSPAALASPGPAAPGVEDLIRASDAVVRARVGRVEARWIGTRIFTFATLEAVVPWRGRLADGATVIAPGGEVGDLGQRVSGSPTFAPGEEVVLFLQAAEGGAHRVAGMARGKLTVRAGFAVAGEGAAGPAVPLAVLEQRVRAAR